MVGAKRIDCWAWWTCSPRPTSMRTRKRTVARRTSNNQGSGRQHMTATIEHIRAARAHRSTIGTLRLRLKPAHRSCGFVQGAWWPRSTRLADELPSLLEALSLRFDTIDRVRYHQSDWSTTTPSIKHQGGDVILDASQDSPTVITVFGQQLGRLALLVVPPYTDHSDACTAVRTAASAGDVSTPSQLLGLGEQSAKDRHHTLIALQRWETEGGAVGDPASQSRSQSNERSADGIDLRS